MSHAHHALLIVLSAVITVSLVLLIAQHVPHITNSIHPFTQTQQVSIALNYAEIYSILISLAIYHNAISMMAALINVQYKTILHVSVSLSVPLMALCK